MKHYLSQCLHSALAALEGLQGEVIVVDNASTDGSVEMVRERFGDRVLLLANPDNPGFAKANNQAMRIARGRYFLLLNPDTLVPEDAFRRCLDHMDQHPEVGGLGVYMHDGEGVFLPESKRALPTPWVSFYKIFGLAALFPNSRRFGQYHLSYLSPDETHEVDILSGAFMWLRKSALDKVGLLDETYFMYGEDIDLSWRLVQGGYKNNYFAGTRILHYKGESTKKGSLNYVRVFYQAMIIFAQRHFGGQHRRSFILAIRLAVYLRAFLAVAQRLVKRFGLPVLELGLVYGILFGIQAYWEHYVKYIEGGAYPAEFKQIYLPAYALVFVGLLAWGGAYRRPFRLQPLLTAPFWGFIAIATATYMFPFVQNFSRAIVGLGAVFTSMMSLGIRGLINWRENGQFFFTERKRKRVLLAGPPDLIDEAVSLILSELQDPVELIGAVSEGKPEKIARLGGMSSLRQWVALLEVEEVVLTNQHNHCGEVLEQMLALRGSGASVKLLPPDDPVLIGPQEVITAQVGRSMGDALRQPPALRAKRRTEWLASTGLLLLFPVTFWAYQRPLAALQALARVWRGRRSLVGYATPPSGELPPLPPGYLHLGHRLSTQGKDLDPEILNRLYARDFRWELDVEIIWRNWRRLGC